MNTLQSPYFKRVCGFLAALVLVFTFCACAAKESADTTQATMEAIVPQETQKEMSVSDLLKATLTLKDDLELSLDYIKEGEPDAAREKLDSVSVKTGTVRKSLDATMKNIGDSMPSMQKELKNMQGLLDLVDMVVDTLLKPALDYMEAHPLEEMKTEDGVRTELICDYIGFVESLMPNISAMVAYANTVDLSLVDSDGEITEYLVKANDLLEVYDKDRAVFSQIKNMLGANGDRLYVVAAQNSAEIRASGGFPGAVGTIRIQNGVLTMGEFKRVNSMLLPSALPDANVSAIENKLFPGGMAYPRDADYCPDFERVGYIWARGYERLHKENVDGVISLTPAIVQMVLETLDEEIKLFDGTVLTGENAVKALQHDIYYKYFGKEYIVGGNSTADQLFADAAKKTSQLVMENVAVDKLLGYVSVAEDCLKERMLMFWMKDENEQALVRKLGWNAGLPSDPENPQAGIYFSCTVASKMGWYLVRDVEIGECTKNEDGSYTYLMTVNLSNAMTKEDLKQATGYITGNAGGSLIGNVYFFAPAGGTVSNFVASNGAKIAEEEYNGLQLGYFKRLKLKPGETVTVAYELTTAPGAEAPLTLSMTPTVQAYH